jgi:hypothetical protein
MSRVGFLLTLFACGAIVHLPVRAGSTLIDFTDGTVGLLTDQTPADSFTAQSNTGEFAGPASTQNTVFLEYNGARIVSDGADTVSIRIILHPAGDVSEVLCMFIADASFPASACTACLDADDIFVMTLRAADGTTDELTVPFPNATNNEFTLTFDLQTGIAELIRPTSGGGTAQVSVENAVDGAESVVVGLYTIGSGAINNVLFEGPSMPDFPPAIERDLPHVDFTFQSPGYGTTEFPFATLADVLTESNPGATVLFAPGVSPEIAAISKALTLTNNNPVGGPVRVGVTSARQSAVHDESTRTGFVSRRR